MTDPPRPWRQARKLSRSYGSSDLERLLDFYLGCVEAEDLRSLRLNIGMRNKIFLAPWADDVLLAPEAQEVGLGHLGANERAFLERGMAQAGQRERLFYGYPVYVGEDDYLTPLLFTEVIAERRASAGEWLLLRAEAVDVHLNHHVLAAKGLGLEEIQHIEDSLEEIGSVPARLESIFELLEDTPPGRPDGDPLVPAGPARGQWVARPVLFRSEHSGFTQQLRRELEALRRYPSIRESAFGTALGLVLAGRAAASTPCMPASRPEISPVVPLSRTQREAAEAGLRRPLTVVTGPPGTGKSQVVVAVLASMALAGKSVLFASKNNRAVDVVRERLRELLGEQYDWTLRLGSGDHMAAAEQEMRARLEALSDTSLPPSADQRERAQVEKECDAVGRRLDGLQAALKAFAKTAGALAAAEAALPDSLLAASDTPGDEDVPLPGDFEDRLETCRGLVTGQGLSLWWRLLRAIVPGMVAARAEAGLRELAGGTPAAVNEHVAGLLRTERGRPGWQQLKAAAEILKRHAGRVRAALAHRQARQAVLSAEDAQTLLQQATRLEQRRAVVAGHSFRRQWSERVFAGGPALRLLVRRYFDQAERLRTVKGREAWLAAKRELDSTCARLVPYLPVWVVTNLSVRRALALTPGLFDLVVIDEASQCDVPSAFPLLFRAKRALIIGDPRQLRHISVLRPQEEEAVATSSGCSDMLADWSYIRNSLYDVAEAAVIRDGGEPFLLAEHYRSHPDIIEFSNQSFYQGQLVLRTDLEALQKRAAGLPLGVWWHDVPGQAGPARASAWNPAEIEAILTALDSWARDGFGGSSASVGIVTPFRLQMERLEEALTRRPWWQRFKDRVTVGTAHRFQGDERDMMLFSTVVAPGLRDHSVRWVADTDQLINVAVTRARGALHVFGHKQACLEAGGYLERLARHVLAVPSVRAYESEAERDMAKLLSGAGLWFWPQVAAGRYRLDFAVVSPFGARYDVEIDGRQHFTPEGVAADELRDRFVESLGYRVLRVRATQLFEAPEEVAAVLRRLA